ncbi:MAG: thiamine pyrophosphate-binding protein [Puniceicoccaceae bacterium]
MKASDYIADYLHEKGVDVVFEVVGGMITHLLDSVHRRGQLRVVSMHHEQAAAFAVDGLGRMRNRPAVAMATSGPGATNLLTGIGSCYFDSVAAVFITGQVNTHELKGDSGVRQLGFQETDIVSMARPITKGAWLVEDAASLPEVLDSAFSLAMSGRPGPVLVDIPMNVQRDPVEAGKISPPKASTSTVELPDEFWPSLGSANRPLAIIGSGGAQPGIREPLRAFLEGLGIPAVFSLLGNDVLEHSHPQRVGFYGSYGNRWSNYAVGRADWLLVLGSRLDIRQTGADVESFKSGKKVFHVDVDPTEVNNRVEGCHAIVADLQAFVASASASMPEVSLEIADWYAEIDHKRSEWPVEAEYRSTKGINPCRFLADLSRQGKAARAYVADVGQHQMWSAQCLELARGQRFLTSGGMGAMGYGLPAAIGAVCSEGTGPVVLVAGDGGFQLNLQEMETVRRNSLPVKMLIINNRCHGMVRQFQQSYFHSRYHSTMWGYSAPDFSKVSEAYGIPAMTIEGEGQVPAALDFFWKDPAEPVLLQLMLDPEGNVYPKIAFGHPLTEMEPEFKPLEMEGT